MHEFEDCCRRCVTSRACCVSRKGVLVSPLFAVILSNTASLFDLSNMLLLSDVSVESR